MKRRTLTNRWIRWARTEPAWAYSALASMMIMFASLGVHLIPAIPGTPRKAALIVLLASGVLCEVILVVRRQSWWAGFWGCVLASLVLWEALSYYLGGRW